MDCKEFLENVSAAVDGCLRQEAKDAFAEHAGKCPSCRYEYAMEYVTKSIVRTRARVVSTPDTLLHRITVELEHVEEPSSSTAFTWWKDLLRKPALRPAIAFGVAFIAIILFVSPPLQEDSRITTGSLAANDVILQSFANYLAVKQGDMQPQLESNQPEHLQTFFTGKTTFPVLVPKIKDCRLVGGVLKDFAGMNFAHVLYKRNDSIVYVYETCWQTVQEGKKLNLPQAAKEELQRTGWFSESRPDGHTVVLWIKGRTLCAAVARMNKDDLMASLTAGELSGN